jgi:ribosomal protein S18 acetylase RimI-like enzyme
MQLAWSHSIEGVNWEELAQLFSAAPLGDKNPVDLKVTFLNSMFVCFALDANRLVGVGRVLADGVDCAYICDIAVLPSHQGTGIGRAILTDLVKRSRHHKKLILYSVPGKEPFYEKAGFKRMTTAMAIFKDQNQAVASGYIDET